MFLWTVVLPFCIHATIATNTTTLCPLVGVLESLCAPNGKTLGPVYLSVIDGRGKSAKTGPFLARTTKHQSINQGSEDILQLYN